MALFTTENAAELAEKRWKLCPTHSKPDTALMTLDAPVVIREQNQARACNEMLKIIDEQIRNTRELLNSDPEPVVYCQCSKCGKEMVVCGMPNHHRAQLLKALDSLIERKTELLGIPSPGSYRPTKSNGFSRRPTVSPIEPETPPVAT